MEGASKPKATDTKINREYGLFCMGARCRCNIMPKYMPYGKDVSATCKKTLGKLG